MKLRFLASFAVLSVLGTGCVVDNPAAYDSCKSAKDCSGAFADTCVTVTLNWGGTSSTGGMCSTGCSSDSGCSVSANGRLGYCSATAIVGASAGTCFERCYYDTDCSPGYVCGNSKEVPGLPSREQICVPQPPAVYVPPPADPYTYCQYANECSTAGADTCVSLTQDWGGGDVVQTSMCSTGCTADTQCSYSWNGNYGYCATKSIVGAPAGTCFERCYYDDDCAFGYVCASSKEVPGLPTNELVCVPAPNASYTPPAQDAYQTCASLSECGSTLTRCEQLDPKWEGTSDSFQLNICTKACGFDSDCPTSSNGYSGYCAPQYAISDMQVCVERCAYQYDCDAGFICAQMSTITGLPESTEGICVPDPKY